MSRTTRLKAARARVRELADDRQAARLERQAEILELAGTPAGRPLRESSPTSLDWINAYSTILDRLRGEPYSYQITSPYDRKYGRNFPIYQSEAELSLLRAPSRILCQTNTYAQALVGGLRSYIIGPGYTYRAAAREKVKAPESLVEAVQAVVDRFLRRNQWNASGPWAELDQLPLKPIEGEAFERGLRDGETTLLHTWDEDAGETQVRFVEPEFITAPPGGRWEEWSFGWRTPPNDEQRKISAWISWTGNPADGEEVPVDRLSYLPRNADRVLKRGVPDFAFDAYDALNTAQRLRRALSVGGAVKAGIVGVRQHKAQTMAQTQAFADQLTDVQTVDLVTGLPRNVRRYVPGEFEDIDENMEYVRGPGTDTEAALCEILNACLRGAVVRWNGFEWLVSADASSNSYANALAAQSPAVKRVGDEQASYKALFLRSIAIAVKDAADAGLIRADGRTWEWLQIRQLVEVQVEAPSAEVQDQEGEAQRDLALNQARAKSIQTICQEQGLDYEREMANIEEHEERFGGAGVPLDLPEDEESSAAGDQLPKPPKAGPPAAPKPPPVRQASLESRLEAIEDGMRQLLEWDESKVHRGQPGNAGEFGSGGGGAAAKPTFADKRKIVAAKKAKRAARNAVVQSVLGPVADKAKLAATAAGKLGAAVWGKIPGPVQHVLSRTYGLAMKVDHKLELGHHVAQAMVSQIVRERNLPLKHAARVERITRVADTVAKWTTNIPVVHHYIEAAELLGGPAAFAAAKVGYYIPVASLAYIGYSTARNPMATARAARNLLMAWGHGKSTAHVHESREEDDAPAYDEKAVAALCDGFAAAGDGDWYMALVSAALDETHDLADAVRRADAVYAKVGDNPAADSDDFDFDPLKGFRPVGE